MPEVKFSHVTDQHISIMLDDGSVCQLDRADHMKDSLNIHVRGPLFWFCRIKAKREGKGSGTLMMRELVKILEEKRWSVLNSLNPYGGKKDLERLINFNKKFGFELLNGASGTMIRLYRLNVLRIFPVLMLWSGRDL